MNAPIDDLLTGTRLITVACPREGALAGALVVEQLSGREGVNALFLFELDVLATTADLDIDALAGAAVSLFLLQADGSRRAWHGQCTHAGARGADGGLARYRLRIEPALAQLRQRRDSHVFQDLDARAIVGELLIDYPDVQCSFDLTRALPQRAIRTQYRETDFAFLCRVLACEGLSWRFDHAGDGASHCLVIFDAMTGIPATAGGDMLRFHGVRATDVDDAIDSWHARRRVTANAIALSSWDPAQLMAPAAEQQSLRDAGVLPAMSIYDGSGERIASMDAIDHGRLMLQALDADHKVFDGAGAVRRLAPGYGFSLAQHAAYPDGANRFTVLSVTHAARNNLRTGIADAVTGEGAMYRNRFTCVRDSIAIVPPAVAAASPCTASGTQVALVVGVPDALSTTTRDHQVKVQFAWQRGDAPNPGGLDHPAAKGGNAPGNASSGAWVRVAEALAGPNWGSQFTPRIGAEVLVAFIEGDIDRPVIVGQLHNGMAPPPFPAGADAPANHAGVLSGIHTRNADGAGYNQWQLDDSPAQLRMRLASSSAGSELHLGRLVQQTIGTSLRGAARGAGFELRTDAWAVLRGGAGVLLSTSARPALGSGITSTQMDAQEALSVAHGARSLGDALTQAAEQQHALSSTAATTAQAGFIGRCDPAVQGRYEAPVNGQPACQPRAGTRALETSRPVERLAAAAVRLDAAASINLATPGPCLVTAGQHLHWTTQSDLHLAAGTAFSTVAGGSASLFSHGGGVQAMAGNGPLSLQAHTGALEVIADKEVVVLSVGAAIAVQAKTTIVLQAGQSSITLDGGDITFACSGNFEAKGGQHVFDGGASGKAALATLPAALASMAPPIAAAAPPPLHDEQIVYRDSHGKAIAAMPVDVVNQANAEQQLQHDSPADGVLERLGTPAAEPLAYALRYATYKFS